MSEPIFLDTATIEKIHEASILAFGDYDAMIAIAEKRLDKAGLAGVFQLVLSP